jgi:hypothetical protein
MAMHCCICGLAEAFVHNYVSSLFLVLCKCKGSLYRGTFSFSFSSFNDPWGFCLSHLLADPSSHRHLVSQSLPSLVRMRGS